MKPWLWLALLPALVLAAPPSVQPIPAGPIYVDVEPEQIIIYPDKLHIAKSDIHIPGGEFEKFLDQVEGVRDTCEIVLLLRPGSAVFQRQLRQLIRDRGVDIRFKLIENDRAINVQELTAELAVVSPPSTTADHSPPGSVDTLASSPDPISVLVATPKNRNGDSQPPVFFECRHQQLFFISLDALHKACEQKTVELRARANNDENEFLKWAAQTTLEVDGQRIDYTYALLGKYVMTSIPDAMGYPFENHLNETDDMWYGSKLSVLDPDKQPICFFVRPDSYPTFQQARAAAGLKNINVTCELLKENDPIMLGADGSRLLP